MARVRWAQVDAQLLKFGSDSTMTAEEVIGNWEMLQRMAASKGPALKSPQSRGASKKRLHSLQVGSAPRVLGSLELCHHRKCCNLLSI